MKKFKILNVFGTRPQYVKAKLLSERLNNYEIFEQVLIDSGQHYDDQMSLVFKSQFNLSIKYNLNCFNLNSSDRLNYLIEKLNKIFSLEKPKAIIVYGDTDTTLCATISAIKNKIFVFHVEAGVRSFNFNMQEEINRVMVDSVSSLLFCPTLEAYKYISESISTKDPRKIIFSGDLMYELFLKESESINKFESKDVLVTIHREENDQNLLKIVDSLSYNKNRNFNFILHPRHLKSEHLIKDKYKNIDVIKPLSHKDFIEMLFSSKLVITDSGGLQREAFFAKKKCLVVRRETEWEEIINSKAGILVSDINKLKDLKLFTDFSELGYDKNLFGNGETSKIICDSIVNFFSDEM